MFISKLDDYVIIITLNVGKYIVRYSWTLMKCSSKININYKFYRMVGSSLIFENFSLVNTTV